MTKNLLYNRERKIALRFHDITQEFIFIALSARGRETMLAEAQQIHAGIVRQFAEAAESIRNIYRLQDREILTESMLQAEQELFTAKAALTLTGDEEDYRERIAAEAEIIMEERRAELLRTDKELLIERLVSLEIDRRLQTAWACAVLDATLVQILHDAGRRPLFSTVDEMKDALPPEALEKLYESLVDFLTEGGNAQVFLKPHTSRG